MEKRIKLTFVGGGSYQWAPRLLKDLMLKKSLEAIDFCLFDLNRASAADILKLGERMNRELQANHSFRIAAAAEEAFDGADFVLVCISTGGLDAMAHDLAIPEKYGIYHTVGDTVGPGGWSRSLRNVPVFNRLARQIEQGSPQAVVLNYTNPLACLTKAFCARTKLRAVGLCHGLFENDEALRQIFGLDREERLKLRFGGVNHFFWLLDYRVDGLDGPGLLAEKLRGGKRFEDLLDESRADEAGFRSNKALTSELYATYGYLPYVGDRHTCEFLPHIVTDRAMLEHYRIARTTVEQRRAGLADNIDRVRRMAAGEEPIVYDKSREAAADIVEAIATGKEYIDIVNLPNVGQIPNLPLGSIVETLGVVNPIGFTPLAAGPLPDRLLPLVRPHAENVELIYRAATEGDFELALQALYNDPSCSRLDYRDIRRMGEELLAANRELLPQFFA